MEAGFRWIRENRRLGHGPPSIVHNDYNFNNILVYGDRVSAVVDWEFAHVGTPAADLGYIYYAAEHVASFDFFCAEYARAGGTVPDRQQLDFYIFWGQLRLGVMAFQGAQHVDAGRLLDIRFAMARQHRRRATLRVAERLAAMGLSAPNPPPGDRKSRADYG
jgi:aminoglycoside phosphotransferase (APT) family kinase protein